METKGSKRGSRRSRLSVIGVAMVMVIGGGVTATAAASSGDSDPSPSIPKTQLPANINPDKAPVTDPSKISPEVAVPISVQQQAAQARTWAAQEPNTRLVCFRPDGSVAGMADLDRVDPSRPLTASAAADFCNRAAPGSHP